MRRILFIHHRPQPSGAARSLALLIGALDEGWEPHVVVPGGGAAALFEAAGAVVHRAPVPAFVHTWDVQYRGLRWLVAVRELSSLPGHWRALRRLLRDLQPDVVHVNDVVMVASASIAARAGVPVVWHLRSSLPNDGRDRRSRAICRLVDRYAAAAVAIDDDVAATYRLRVPLVVVPNPIRVDNAAPAELHVPDGRVTVGFFGYLRRQKGWPQLVEAATILAREGLPVHFVVVGGGVRGAESFRGLRGRFLNAVGVHDEEGELRALIHAHGLEPRFTFIPFTLDPGSVYAALDIVTFPNQGVGLGRPVLEAAAHGKAVVASGSTTGGGIVTPGSSVVLLPTGSPAEIAEAIAELVMDHDLRARLGSAAAAEVAGLAPEKTAARMTQTWTDVLKQ